MPHIDPPESCLPTAGTALIALVAAAALTFCTPAPAATQHTDLDKRCARTTIAFIAALQAEEHECREAFTYKGVRLFDPHLTVQKLMEAACPKT